MDKGSLAALEFCGEAERGDDAKDGLASVFYALPRWRRENVAFHQYPRVTTISGRTAELMGYAVRVDDYRHVG